MIFLLDQWKKEKSPWTISSSDFLSAQSEFIGPFTIANIEKTNRFLMNLLWLLFVGKENNKHNSYMSYREFIAYLLSLLSQVHGYMINIRKK